MIIISGVAAIFILVLYILVHENAKMKKANLLRKEHACVYSETSNKDPPRYRDNLSTCFYIPHANTL